MCAVPRMTRPVAAVLASLALLSGCTDPATPRATPSPSVSLPTLPPGDLREKVLQPDEVSRALVPIAAQTGARDATGIAAFSSDTAAAAKALQEHGFQAAYVVQYGDPATNAVVTNVVSRFATVAGATADLTGDLKSSGRAGAFEVTGLGEQAGGITGKRDPSSAEGTLVTLRWRVGDTTWLLAVSATTPVDQAGVRRLADTLMTRLAKGTSS